MERREVREREGCRGLFLGGGGVFVFRGSVIFQEDVIVSQAKGAQDEQWRVDLEEAGVQHSVRNPFQLVLVYGLVVSFYLALVAKIRLPLRVVLWFSMHCVVSMVLVVCWVFF